MIVGGGDMVITGIGNIYSDGALKFKQVPITVHLMGKAACNGAYNRHS